MTTNQDIEKPPYDAESMAAFEELMEGAQSDRAIAVLGFAMLDDWLSEVVKAVIIRPKNQENKNMLFGPNGFLYTAGAKTEMLFRFGLLPTLTYSDLSLMRKIRNEFAHSPKAGASFDAEKISRLTEKLRSAKEMVSFLKPEGVNVDWYEEHLLSSRGRFVAHVVKVRGDLVSIESVATRREAPEHPVWTK